MNIRCPPHLLWNSLSALQNHRSILLISLWQGLTMTSCFTQNCEEEVEKKLASNSMIPCKRLLGQEWCESQGTEQPRTYFHGLYRLDCVTLHVGACSLFATCLDEHWYGTLKWGPHVFLIHFQQLWITMTLIVFWRIVKDSLTSNDNILATRKPDSLSSFLFCRDKRELIG
jgi:hypothetical protein